MDRDHPQGLNLHRRGLLAVGAALICARPALANAPGLVLNGHLVQGGSVIGRTAPRAQIFLNGQLTGAASARGLFVIGFDRDEPAAATLDVRTPDGSTQHDLVIAPETFDIQRIDGLPQDQVAPSDPVLLARIRAEAERKALGFTSDIDSDDFRDGFVLPVKEFRLAARFGGQRILNGQPNRPHYGDDLAAPVGTPITAPAPGVIAFAETGLHFDGGLVLIDHGQGLISCYLHMSAVEATAGQAVARGQRIGAVGKEGRATGPHLCWRLKWRTRNLDPMLLLDIRAPA